jgi:16S rRNA (cytosine967-C5)-methyltransferase
MLVEHACAFVLDEVERTLKTFRYVVERRRPPVPRPVLTALCLGVLRNYRLLARALRTCGYRGQIRGSARGWLSLVGAYEAMFRRSRFTPEDVSQRTDLDLEIARCLSEIRPDDVVSGLKGLERLSILYSLPTWVVEELAKLDVPGGLEALLRALQEPTPLWVRFNSRLLSADEAVKELSRLGVVVVPDPVLPDLFEVKRMAPNAPAKMDMRKFYMQDRATALVAHILSSHADASALGDFFSAPGNKSAHLHWLAGPYFGAAVEVSQQRLRDELHLHRRQDVHTLDYVLGDSRSPPLRAAALSSAIVDPDCTSIGRVGHSPETRLFLERAGRIIVRRFSKLQAASLRAVLERVKRGAVVVYSTCTLTLQENEEVVKSIIDEGLAEPLEPLKPLVGVPGGVPGSQRLYPHLSRSTGGFVAALRRA